MSKVWTVLCPVELHHRGQKWWDEDRLVPFPIGSLCWAKILKMTDEVLNMEAHCFWCGEKFTVGDEQYFIGFHHDIPPKRYHIHCLEGDIAKYQEERKADGYHGNTAAEIKAANEAASARREMARLNKEKKAKED